MEKRTLEVLSVTVAVSLAFWLPMAVMAGPSLKFATVDNFPPFSFLDKEQLVGVDVDVIHEMAQRVGIEIEIAAYPWVRVMEYVKDGTVDGGFSAFLTPQRQAFCLYVGILHYEEFHIFVKKGKEFPFSGIEDLYGKTVGKDIGVHVSHDFEKAATDGRITVEMVNDVDLLNLKKLSMDRIDVMIGDFGVTTYHANKMAMGREIVSLGPIHDRRAAYLVLSKKSTVPDIRGWQKKMSDVLADIWQDGTYEAILARYASKK